MKKMPTGFNYNKTKSIYIQKYKDGKWEQGKLINEDYISLHVMSSALHYGQEAFEGMKAYRRKDGNIQLFRIRDNAKRFQHSCERVLMPKLPVEDFVKGVLETVKDNASFVPPYGSNATMYIRPFMFGAAENLALTPAKEFLFIVVVTPVASYFKGASKGINLVTSDYDRAAPMGTGSAKVGGNYASSLYPKKIAAEQGFDECIFLDPLTHTKIEEVGAANFFGITKDLKYISPVSPSILKGITNDSLKWLWKNILKLEVEERDVYIDELDQFIEANACGTAALISPIHSITHQNKRHEFPTGNQMGEYSYKLYELLYGIQTGDLEDPNNWVTLIEIND